MNRFKQLCWDGWVSMHEHGQIWLFYNACWASHYKRGQILEIPIEELWTLSTAIFYWEKLEMPRLHRIRRGDKKIKNVSNVCVVEHHWKVDILPSDQAWRNILKLSGDMPSGQKELRSSWNQSDQWLGLLLVQKIEPLMDRLEKCGECNLQPSLFWNRVFCLFDLGFRHFTVSVPTVPICSARPKWLVLPSAMSSLASGCPQLSH